MQKISGITRLTFGTPETVTPVKLRHFQPAYDHLGKMAAADGPPFAPEKVTTRNNSRGFQVELPLDDDEQLFGLGLQFLSFNQTGKKKTLRVNSDPRVDLGDSHSPVPFYVSTKGYAVLIDTARYATFYLGALTKRRNRSNEGAAGDSEVGTAIETLYDCKEQAAERSVLVDIPTAGGVDVYIFEGPTMKEAIARYNLFSGGGCVPPRWGLGVWYRCKADYDQQGIVEMADRLRDEKMPCDVMGLEPGWQSQSYSCSFVWSDKFTKPAEMFSALSERGFKTNLWTHGFTHPASPIYKKLLPYSGEYEVFSQGLVPDFTMKETRDIFGEHFDKEHVSCGAAGYKLDECDNSDFIAAWPWSFPEADSFPSGLDGEQMHSLFGFNFQECINDIFRKRNQRTWCQTRNTHALAAPYPFVHTSDLYKHSDFIRGLVNSGFGGLLWCPEVRHAASAEDLVRRIQSVVLSPLALINAWYIQNPPWKQWDRHLNNDDKLLDDGGELENNCRKILELRMKLLPYIHSAFYDYHLNGIPPFRALVMDWPKDEETWQIDDQYMVGDRIMVAPVTAESSSREIYFPAGQWYDFWTGQKYDGGNKVSFDVPLDRIPIFVKSGSVLPLATVTQHTNDPEAFKLQVRVYGDGSLPIRLFEDDDASMDYENGSYNTLSLSWDSTKQDIVSERQGNTPANEYSVSGIEIVKEIS